MKKLIMLIVLIPVAGFGQTKSICGTADDRIPSFTNEIGRISELKEYAGCTATMISNDCAITAGHCFRYEMVKMEFNTPNSPDNTPQAAKDSDTYEGLGNKVLGSPINIRFNELFIVEKLTILGKISDAFKKKLQPMNPIIKSYVGGIN